MFLWTGLHRLRLLLQKRFCYVSLAFVAAAAVQAQVTADGAADAAAASEAHCHRRGAIIGASSERESKK